MLKKINSTIILLIFSSLGVLGIETNLARATDDASLLFDQATVSTTVGQTVTLVARIDPGTNEIEGVELDITFNPAVLRLDTITRSAIFNTTLAGPTIDNSGGAGSIDVGSPAATVNTTSSVATFSFTTLATATNSPVSFAITSDASSALDGNVIVTRTGSQVTVTTSGDEDTTDPTVTAFDIPATVTSLTVPITTFTATDNTAVTGYKVTESSSAPAAGDAGWTVTAPANYVFTIAGTKNLYAWAKDAAGNVSASLNDSVIITIADEFEGEEDITAPSVYNGIPTGKLSSSTESVDLSVLTDEAATCKYSTVENIAYNQMTLTFGSTGGTSHYQKIDDLDDDKTYKYYVRCKDEDNNINSADYLVTFSIKEKSSNKDDEKGKETKRKISNSKSKLKRGDTLVQSGKRFSKNSDVLLYFSKADGGYYAPKKVKTSSSGKFSVSYKINKSAGKYEWYAVDTKTGRKSKTKSYTVR